MRPNLLLMCKLLLALLVLHGFASSLSDPFLPFISGLDLLRSPSGWLGRLLQISFIGAACCLVFNYRVRWAAVTLGVIVVLTLLSSRTVFRNHLFIVGCLFLLSGLQRKDDDAWMLRWQMVIIYGGAFLNKILQVDWRSGQFMHHWLHVELANPYYEAVWRILPEPDLAIIISWCVMGSELALAILFLRRRWNAVAVSVAIVMHAGFFILVGRTIFGHFTEDVLLAMMAFLAWPSGVMAVRLKPSLQRSAQALRSWFDWERQLIFGTTLRDSGNWMELSAGDRTISNGAATWHVLKYSPAFYFGVFGVFNGVAYLLAHY